MVYGLSLLLSAKSTAIDRLVVLAELRRSLVSVPQLRLSRLLRRRLVVVRWLLTVVPLLRRLRLVPPVTWTLWHVATVVSGDKGTLRGLEGLEV